MKGRDTLRGARHESRRRFTKAAIAAAVAAPAGLAAAAKSQTPARPPEAAAPPKPDPTPQAQQPPPPAAAAYAEVARALYGDKLTPEEFERVRRDLEGNARASERLRAAKLANSDEPDFTFGA